MSYVYYNGKCGKWEEIFVPLSDRALFFGDGVYDAALGKGGKIYLLDEHTERFTGNLEKLHIPIPHSSDEIKTILKKVCIESGIDEYFLYFQASANADERRHAPRDSNKSNFLIYVKPFKITKKELSLISYPDIRQRFCHIKTVNLLGSVMASEAACNAGADEAVLVKNGAVSECAHSNIAIIKDGVLITHPENEKILPGIMQRELIKSARILGIKNTERCFSLSEIFSADDVILTSTSKLAARAVMLDGIKISSGNHSFGDALMEHMFKDFENFCLN